MLNFARPLEADSLFKYLQTTLGISMSGFYHEDDDGGPTGLTLDAWYFTLQLMGYLHDIAVEQVEFKK